MVRRLTVRPMWAAIAVSAASLLSACSDPVGPADRDDVAAWMEFHDVPGVSVAVIDDFSLDYVETHGVKSRLTQEPVTEHTLFQAASLTKGMSAVGVVRLAQEGVVSLDQDVNEYLTSWQVPDKRVSRPPSGSRCDASSATPPVRRCPASGATDTASRFPRRSRS